MAYNLKDVNGELAPGPSINGLRNLKTLFAEQTPTNFPALNDLLDKGYTNKLAQLQVDCRALSKRATDKTVQSTLNSLITSASRAKEIIIMEG